MAGMTQEQVAEIATLINEGVTPTDETNIDTDIDVDDEPVVTEPSDADLDDIDAGIVPDDEIDIDGEPEEGDSAGEVYTIASLAEAIELPASDLYNVKIPLGERGGNEEMTISEMKNAYLDMTDTVTKLEGQVKANEETPMSQAVSDVEMQANYELHSIEAEFKAIDWEDLEEFDPSKAVLTRQKLNDRYQEAQFNLGNVRQHQQEEHNIRMGEAWKKTLDNIPAWSDSEVRDKDITAIGAVLQSVGYAPDFVTAIEDPLAMTLLHELATLRAAKESGKTAAKQVRRAPKVLKTGGRVAPKDASGKTAALVKRAKTTHNKNDEFAAIKAILQGSVTQ